MFYSVFAYPVSGVIKLWHVLLISLGVDPVSSWIVSLLLLVMTVRLILLPCAYAQYKSTRIHVNLRPVIYRIRKEYEDRPGRAARKERIARENQARKAAGFRVSAGCLPILIQLSFFIGLYRVLIHMARPMGNDDSVRHQPIGFLTSADVSQFLEAKAWGVPLPAYAALSSHRLNEMGTDKSTIYAVVIPLVLIASIVTMINVTYSIFRSHRQLEHENVIAVRMHKVMVPVSLAASASPLVFGLIGPVPVAILFYWVGNNLWTMSQNILLYRTLDKKYPYTPEFVEHYELTKAAHDEDTRMKKEKKRALVRNAWRRRAVGIAHPWHIPRLWVEGHHEKAVYRQQMRQRKLEKKQKRLAKRAADRAADKHAAAHSAARTMVTDQGGRHALKENVAAPMRSQPQKIIDTQTRAAIVPQRVAHTMAKPVELRGPLCPDWMPAERIHKNCDE